MAIHTGPGTPSAERLISTGGNVYVMYLEPVRAGYATRGRGFWVGRKRKDTRNPDVDNPLGDGLDACVLEGVTDVADDGFDDNKDPLLALYRKDALRHVGRTHRAQAQSKVESGSGQIFGKSALLAFGDVKMDMLLQNPDDLTRDDLFKSASKVKMLMETGAFVGEEAELLRSYAGKLASAIRGVLHAEQEIAKAILTKPDSEREEEERKSKEAKRPPKKAQEVKQDAQGKTQYKYQKNGDGKGPQSDGVSPPAKTNQPDAETPEVSAPPKIDPEEFCKRVGIAEVQVEKLASKKTRQEFVRFFMGAEDIVEKHKINPAFLGALYDSLTHPEAKEQQPKQQPQPSQAGGNPGIQPMGKSLVVFSAGTLHAPTLAVMDLLKSHKAHTLFDISKCLQTQYALTEDMAWKTTRTLINQWERKGLVKLYPPK